MICSSVQSGPASTGHPSLAYERRRLYASCSLTYLFGCISNDLPRVDVIGKSGGSGVAVTILSFVSPILACVGDGSFGAVCVEFIAVAGSCFVGLNRWWCCLALAEPGVASSVQSVEGSISTVGAISKGKRKCKVMPQKCEVKWACGFVQQIK